MKKLFVILIVFTLSLTGCSVVNLNQKDIDEVIDLVLMKKSSLKNSSFDGYSYYIPRGLYFINKNDYNAVLKDFHNNYYYLYVDVISYHHKIKKAYKIDNDVYFSRKLKNKNKFGYFEINQDENGYFIEAMYNYVKIESYVNEKDLNDAVTNISIVLSSIQYNDKVLDTLVGENKLSYKEEIYNIFDTKKNTSDFLDYIKEYEDAKTDDRPDEDNIKINEGE